MEINTFLDKLQSYHSEQVFNPGVILIQAVI